MTDPEHHRGGFGTERFIAAKLRSRRSPLGLPSQGPVFVVGCCQLSPIPRRSRMRAQPLPRSVAPISRRLSARRLAGLASCTKSEHQRADDLLRPAEDSAGRSGLHRRARRSDRPDRRSGRQAARRAETEDQARRDLPVAAVPLSLRDDAQDVRADDVPGRVLHDRGRGADGRQPGRQDLARARRQGPEVRGQHQARVQGGGRQGASRAA